jgi:dimethylargininase
VLKRLGVTVYRLTENSFYPDGCFIEDTAVVLDELAILTSMGSASRYGETEAVRCQLAKYREISLIKLPAKIEGGDVLKVGKTIFVGLSSRTNLQGIEEFTRILNPLGYSVRPIVVRGCLHLKTACTSLDDSTLILNPEWVDADNFKDFNILFTPVDEPWAANTLNVNDTICSSVDVPRTAELIQKLGKGVVTLDISEFRKAEAGLTCLSLIFQDETI